MTENTAPVLRTGVPMYSEQSVLDQTSSKMGYCLAYTYEGAL